jgi:hypothetical protein
VSTAASTAAVNAPPADLLVSISELARRKGVDKALISRQVGALNLRTYPGKGGAKLVNIAEFDRARGQTGDGVKEQAAATARLFRDEPEQGASGAAPTDGSLASAQRQKLLYEIELRKLELEERNGLLVPVADVIEAQRKIGDAEAQIIDRLPLRAAEMAAAVAKDGEAGARALLKTIAFDLRQAIAEACAQFESQAAAEEAAPPAETKAPAGETE